MKGFVVLVGGMAASLLAATPPIVFAAESARAPEQIWSSTCASCHDTGANDAPKILGQHIPADRVKAVVRNGGVEMGAFTPDQISDQELDALAKWVSAQDAPAK